MAYLKKLESEYGIPNLWPYLAVDRVLMSNQLVREYPYNKPPYTYEEMLKILQVQAKAVTNFLEKEKPDFIFFTQAIGGVGSLLLYNIAKKKGIPILCATINTLPKTVVLSDNYAYLDGVEKKFAELIQKPELIKKHINYQKAKTFLSDFQDKPRPYSEIHDRNNYRFDQLKQLDFLLPKKILISIKWFLHLIYEYFVSKIRYDYTYTNPIYYLADRIKRKVRGLKRIKYEKINPDEPYAFFPLQLEPEVSLLLLASWATDQRHIIKQIAKSLPVGYKLYVKEHPQMVSYRPMSYYEELKKIPNIILIDPRINSFEVIKHAKLITTITGTVGWEAILLKKPVITFGDIFYNKIPGVKNCRTMEQLPWLVKEQIENFNYNEETLVAYICAVLDDAAQNIDLLQLWERETDEEKKRQNLQPLVDLLAKKMNLINNNQEKI